MIRVTENELLAALADARPDAPPDAMTSGEIAKHLGLQRTAVKQRLQRLHREGRLVIWKTRRVDMSGREQVVPAYTIKSEKKRKRA